MDRVLTDKNVTARKHHKCDASAWWLRSDATIDECTPDQRLVVEAAEADRWRILPGQQYRRVTGVYEGDLTTYRERLGMGAVCSELELFDE